jgi:hypothetical protein
MNLLHLLGTLALGVGGSLLLSSLVLGPDLVGEVTGSSLGTLYGSGIVVAILGAVAVRLGRQEEHEARSRKGGKEG